MMFSYGDKRRKTGAAGTDGKGDWFAHGPAAIETTPAIAFNKNEEKLIVS
jgi:hypothetical protein